MTGSDYAACVYLREDVPLTLGLWAGLAKGPDDIIEIDDGGEYFVRVRGRGVAVLSVPISYEAEGATLSATQMMLWPDIETELAAHTCHFLITSFGETVSDHVDARAIADSVLRVAARLAELPQVIGVHWRGSGLDLPKTMFLGAMDATPNWPPSLVVLRPRWSGRPRPRGDGIGAETFGFSTLLLPELRHGHTGEHQSVISERIYGIAEYLLGNGPIIKDGETIGGTSEHPMKATVGRYEGQDYIALGFDNPDPEPAKPRRNGVTRLFDRLRRGP